LLAADWSLSAVLAFVLLAALVAAESRDLVASAVAAGAVGVGAAVSFLLLGAPDLALLHLAGAAVVAVALVRGAAPREEAVPAGGRDALTAAVGLAGAGVLITACTVVFVQPGPGRGLPAFGSPVALAPAEEPAAAGAAARARAGRPEVRGVSRLYLDASHRQLSAEQRGAAPAAAPGLHLPNRVAAVALDYRGYDTLGLAAVFLAAVVGALAVLRRGAATGGGG